MLCILRRGSNWKWVDFNWNHVLSIGFWRFKKEKQLNVDYFKWCPFLSINFLGVSKEKHLSGDWFQLKSFLTNKFLWGSKGKAIKNTLISTEIYWNHVLSIGFFGDWLHLKSLLQLIILSSLDLVPKKIPSYWVDQNCWARGPYTNEYPTLRVDN